MLGTYLGQLQASVGFSSELSTMAHVFPHMRAFKVWLSILKIVGRFYHLEQRLPRIFTYENSFFKYNNLDFLGRGSSGIVCISAA